jgi:DNA-binding CsgD family transcriptional regulator
VVACCAWDIPLVNTDGETSQRERRRLRHKGERVHVDAVPATDPAAAIIQAILKVVPVSRWAFARVRTDGDLEKLLGSEALVTSQPKLETELKRQRSGVLSGPKIAAALAPMNEFASGITLLFADDRATFGILTLMRKADLGPFTSAEIRILTLALTSASERLSALRLHAHEIAAPSEATLDDDVSRLGAASADEAFYVLDRDMQIVLAWNSANQRRIALTGLQTRIAERLPAVLEETVRELTAGWGKSTAENKPGMARPVPFLVVHTQPVVGPSGLLIGVRLDRYEVPNSLREPAARFHISPREVQVLTLVLDGKHLDEIATQLHITSSTVQDHIRSMVEKTGSRNRSALIARIMGWEFPIDNASL